MFYFLGPFWVSSILHKRPKTQNPKPKAETCKLSVLSIFEMSTIMAVKAASLPYARPTSFRSNPRPNSTIPTARMQTRIHRLIEDQGIVLMPGCYDALSAAIVQKTGFSAGFISGYALSASLLGKPDFGLLTYTPKLIIFS